MLWLKSEFMNMTQVWEKEKFWVPDRNWTHGLPKTGRALYPLSYENSPWVLVAQWIECPPGVQEVMGSIPVRDSESFLYPMLLSCW